MSNWTLAPCLRQLFREIDTVWPHRDREVDGTIGDPKHAASRSEHNPNTDPSDDVPDGMVTAIDVTAAGINVQRLLSHVIGDDRVWYVIWDRRICSRTHGWNWLPYTGESPHTDHVHISATQSAATLRSTRGWGLAVTSEPKAVPTYAQLKAIAHRRLIRIRKLLRRG